MSTTNGLRFLKQKEIPYLASEYDHQVKGAEYAAQALEWPLKSMAKTLVVALSDGSFVQCLLPADEELSLKKLARAAGMKSARMSRPEEAEKLTGYLVGGISPFGVRKRMDVWIHGSLMEFGQIGVNGGKRGLIVFLGPEAIREVLGARITDLAT